MKPIRLVQGAVARDAFQEERVKHQPVLLRKLRIDRIEAFREILAEIARRVHAREKHRDLPLDQTGDDRFEIFPGYGRIHPAQGIVGAEFDDDAVGPFRHLSLIHI